jgi:hypothetical protein
MGLESALLGRLNFKEILGDKGHFFSLRGRTGYLFNFKKYMRVSIDVEITRLSTNFALFGMITDLSLTDIPTRKSKSNP